MEVGGCMTQDDVVVMAVNAGANAHFVKHHIAFIEKLAKLVAEAEREACAKACDDLDKSHWGCEVKATWCSEEIRARGQA